MNSRSRRAFLHRILSAGVGVLSAGALGSLAGCAGICPKRIDAPNRTRRVLADLHAHPMLDDWVRRAPLALRLSQQVSMIDELIIDEMNQTEIDWATSHQAGVDLICAAHYNPFDELASMPTDPDPGAVRKTLWMMDLLEAESAANSDYVTLLRNREDLVRVLSVDKATDGGRYRIGVVHCLEGGQALGGKLESLKEFARRGVAMIGLTHFFTKTIATSANSLPYFPDDALERCPQGVSEFGRAVIREMESLGMIVDVAHCTAAAIEDVLDTATRPVISSHSSARTLGNHAYSLHDEHIQQIASGGGLVGVILMPHLLSNYSNDGLAKKAGSLDDVVRTIRYLHKICGHTHTHIGIGTDFAGYIPPPKDMRCHGRIELLRRKLMREFDNDVNIVEDIMANNAINFLRDNWGV